MTLKEPDLTIHFITNRVKQITTKNHVEKKRKEAVRETFMEQMQKIEDSIDLSSEEEGGETRVLAIVAPVPSAMDKLGKIVYRIHLHSETALKYPGVKHQWLCDGKLLLLESFGSPEAQELFQVNFVRCRATQWLPFHALQCVQYVWHEMWCMTCMGNNGRECEVSLEVRIR
jgi:hypothetical protein